MDPTLTYIGIALLIIYAAAFYWVFKCAGPEQSKMYTTTFSDRKMFNLIGVALIVGAFLLLNMILAGVFFVAAIAWVTRATILQRNQMMSGGFDQIFVTRLFRISFISAAAIGCLFAAKILESVNAS
jgi:hypothetical protein